MSLKTRRQFGLGAAAGLAFVPQMARGLTKPRVVVIGGGIGGATAAKYLASSGLTLDITLIEPKTSYTTCFMSNLYLAGLRSFESLTHGYEALADRYGIKVIHDFADDVDPVAKLVRLKGGLDVAYDKLVVSPGIAFQFGTIEGYDEAASEIMPHAWMAGPQTKLLRAQLEAMDDGGVFVIAAPQNPFRCPPGPYERASLAAYYFKQFKPRAKILILDAKDGFFEQDLFEDGWNRHYPGMIEWLPGQFTGGVTAVDVKASLVKTAGDSFKANVANIIPAQIAGSFAQKTGLADQSGWCPVDPLTFQSRLQPDIYVVGDAADAGDMPKSAFCANSQAKVCAFAILAALTGSERPASHLFNTCYTYLSSDDAVSDAISFKPAENSLKISGMSMSKVGEKTDIRREAVREAAGWYDTFTHDVFG
jgi:NADPH-dependent 2,4-dienoyl-CoA reductase/sulfur reductase-like enzyme